MEAQPKTGKLAKAAGISMSYASEVLAGKRAPSRPLAIHIFRETGWRHSLIADLTDAQMAMLEEIEPWLPKGTPPAPEASEAA